MNTTNLKWIAYTLSVLMLMQSCKVYNGNGSNSDQSQNSERTLKYYKVWVMKREGIRYRGILYSADKNGVYVTGTTGDSGYLIKPNDIETIKIRRKGKIGRSALIGGVSGFLFGGGLAYLTFEEKDCFMCNILYSTKEEAALFYGIPFGVLGTGIGALIGTKSEVFIINGNTEYYLNQLKRLNEYTLIKQSE